MELRWEHGELHISPNTAKEAEWLEKFSRVLLLPIKEIDPYAHLSAGRRDNDAVSRNQQGD